MFCYFRPPIGGPQQTSTPQPSSSNGQSGPLAAASLTGAAIRHGMGGGRSGPMPGSGPPSPPGRRRTDEDPRVGQPMMRDETFPGASSANTDCLRSIWSKDSTDSDNSSQDNATFSNFSPRGSASFSASREDRERGPFTSQDQNRGDLGYAGRSMESFIGSDGFLGRGRARGPGIGSNVGGVGPSSIGGSAVGNRNAAYSGASSSSAGRGRGYTESTDRYWRC